MAKRRRTKPTTQAFRISICVGILMICSFFSILFSDDYIGSSAKSEDGNIVMDIFPHHITLIDKRENETLYIKIFNSENTNISKDNLSFIGFSSDIDSFNLHKDDKEDYEYSFIRLRNITDNPGVKEKRIVLQDGVATIDGIKNPSVILDFRIHFISERFYVFLSTINFLFWNSLYFIFIMLLSEGRILTGIFLGFAAVVIESHSYSNFHRIIRGNASYGYTTYIIILISIELLYCLYCAKKSLNLNGYALFIIILSTWSLIRFSQIFSLYYLNISSTFSLSPIDIPDIDQQFEWMNDWEHWWKYDIGWAIYYFKFSFRYFFEFPPEDYYGWVAIIQFVIGKIYDIVLLGSIGSIIVNNLKLKKSET
ncbi:hypothetical protein AALD01_02120 [Oscillospiraceae bacterium 21-37]